MSIRPAARALAETGGIRRTALGGLLDTAGRGRDALTATGALDEARGGVGPEDAAASRVGPGTGARVQPALAAINSSASIRHPNETIGSSSTIDRLAEQQAAR
ncbi:MAG TPA: hypothetical protein VGH11_12155 [Jatrophihabitans sp.]